MRFVKSVPVCLAMLVLLAGCPGSESVEADTPAGSAPAAASTAEPAPQPEPPEPLDHAAVFEVDVHGGTLSAEFRYSRDDQLGETFLLNRDFAVTALVCDGEALDPAAVGDALLLDGHYPVSRYTLPRFEESLVICYTGTIGGSPHFATYSRETISPAFTMLRWETFCYPLFADDLHGIFDYLDTEFPLRGSLTLRIPEGYTAATPYPLLEEESGEGTVSLTFDADLAQLSAAIARYNVASLPSGDYYLLPGTDRDSLEALVNPVMAEAQQFLCKTFGDVEIPRAMRYIAIPEGLGGWADTGRAVFLDESAFASEHDTLQLVHEFIHLGWNAKTAAADRAVRRSRFFDEGFTMYFQARVAGHLWGEDAYRAQIERARQSLKTRFGQGYYYPVPMAEFGQREFGDLSYDAGPLFFHGLAELVGTDALDASTGAFLERYRESPANFQLFAAWYGTQLDNPEADRFIDDWLYSTAGIERALYS